MTLTISDIFVNERMFQLRNLRQDPKADFRQTEATLLVFYFSFCVCVCVCALQSPLDQPFVPFCTVETCCICSLSALQLWVKLSNWLSGVLSHDHIQLKFELSIFPFFFLWTSCGPWTNFPKSNENSILLLINFCLLTSSIPGSGSTPLILMVL